MTEITEAQVLPAETFGIAEIVDGCLDIGGVKIPWLAGCNHEPIYIRRLSTDLSVLEIHLARHDGYCQEESDHQNEMAANYPLGPKEYWRTESVGKYLYGSDAHVMTEEDFEQEWNEFAYEDTED